tara:strand:+ start:26345 stop:28093 length:1749 start_codon:yes stop_codon:yes gene_type:complete
MRLIEYVKVSWRLFLLIFLVACEDSQLANVTNALAALREVSSLQMELSATVNEDNLITKADTSATTIDIHLESGEVISALSHLFVDINPNRTDWSIEFRFSATEESLVLPFKGDFVRVELASDFDYTDTFFPLIQPLEISLPFRGRIGYTVHGKSGEAADISSPLTSLSSSSTTEVTVLGLYPEYVNEVSVDYYNKQGVLRSSQTLSVVREGAPPTPDVEVLVNEDAGGPVKLFLSRHRSSLKPFIIDQFGDVRWYTDYTCPRACATQQARNGNVLVANVDEILELSLDGQFVRTYGLPRPYENIHHDIHELRNGDFLLTVNSDELDTEEDVIVLLDRTLSNVKRVWDLNVSVPKNYELMSDENDWLHVNAVTFDESEKSLIISGQRRGLSKVTWDNELVWLLSDGRGFEDWTEFLLDSQHEVFWGQHDVRFDEDNDLYYVFDNGMGRHYSGEDLYSRGVKFRVDETALTSTQIQEYGADLPEYWSPIISGIDYRDDGNVLLNFGSLGYKFTYTSNTDWVGPPVRRVNPEFGAAWVEYDATGKIVFHARFSMLQGADASDASDPGIYRARYADMFSGADLSY